jgi:hypothetical protein
LTASRRYPARLCRACYPRDYLFEGGTACLSRRKSVPSVAGWSRKNPFFATPKWRNWQTRQTQNLVGNREGSSPSLGTILEKDMNSVADMVKGGKKVHFVRYRKDHLYYITECGFEFPVPVGDLGDASCHAEEKALLLMRYIRQHHAVVLAGQQ